MGYTCDELYQWTQKYFPSFKFSKGPNGENELFYPVEAEGWITQRADASVVPPPSNKPHQRGTALYRWRAADLATPDPNKWKAQLPAVGAGQIKLNIGPGGIGNTQFTQRPPLDPRHPREGSSMGDWFLDFAGWSDGFARSYGEMGYTWQYYKQKVYDVLGLPSSTRPAEPSPDDKNPAPPAQFTPDASGLHAYAEFVPLSEILQQMLNFNDLPPELSALKDGQTKIQGEADKLKDLLALTYYLLYPDYVPPDGKLMEGQWEAASVFLQDLGGGNPESRFASYTQGYVGGLFPKPLAACKAISDVEQDSGTHPVSYVAFGSHANYFTPRNDEQSTNSGVDWGKVGGYGAAGVVAAVGVGLIVGGLLASPIGWVAVVAGIILLIIAALIALFTWLFTKNDKDPAPPPYDKGPRNDTHKGDGSPAGGTNIGTPTNPPPNPSPGNGTPPTGGKIPFIVHPISADPSIVDKQCAPPSWWNYVGRWGVCVDDAIAMQMGKSWSNGTWRRMPDGYTLTHRNVEALMDYLLGEIDRKTNVATTNTMGSTPGPSPIG